MVAYADTSFVVALYLQQATSRRAFEIVEALLEPLPLTPLLILEFRNALNLGLKRGAIDLRERNEMWKSFEEDVSNGSYVRAAVSVEEANRVALELSDRFSPTLGTRSLDLLHLASAKILSVKNS